MWTIEEAIQAVELTFPDLHVQVADGDFDYLVGTVEDSEQSIVASFQLLLDLSERTVTEIRIAEGQTYCGYGELAPSGETPTHAVPIQVIRRDKRGTVWGVIGDYEVCIGNEQIEKR